MRHQFGDDWDDADAPLLPSERRDRDTGRCTRLGPEAMLDPPDAAGGGARDQRSTYLHLVVNWLEIEALRSVVGSLETDETPHTACREALLSLDLWRVLEEREAIGRVIRRHSLDSALNDGGLP